MVSPAEEYVLLGLRLGRRVEGLVDAYYGPDELKARVEAEPLAEPAALVEQGDALLASLPDGWLRDQALGLRTYAAVLAGEELSYADEVERCYGVRPERPSTDVYAAAHGRLDELLPGSGDLAARYESWRGRMMVPPETVVPAVRDVARELRSATAELVELPTGEGAVVEEVRDEPWRAFNYYLGGLRSRIAINVDLASTADDVVELAAHEIYPGHHTEHAVKEQLLLRDRDVLEESIQLVPTPAALVSEGIAETGLGLVLGGDMPERLAAVFARYGVEYDLRSARAVYGARRPLRRIVLDAAMLMHDDGATPEEVQAYFERWGLHGPDDASHGVRFVSDREWRAYPITYAAGGELCRAWVGGDPARFARLLTEHVRVRDLSAELSSAA